MFSLNDTSKANIKSVTGLDINQISSMSCNEQITWIEKRKKKSIVFSYVKKGAIAGRGNPLLSRRKFNTMDDLEVKSKRLFGI